MDNESSGEASRKKNSDDDNNTRPLKKAKYLWQVKGKYHLKEASMKMINTNSTSTESAEDNKLSKSTLEAKKENNLNENNIHDATNCNKLYIEAMINNTDRIMDYPLPDSPPPPRNIDKSISDEIPITLVKPKSKSDDLLRKWQARQIAKGFVDNTINHVLENWMIAPFDAADFVENCDNGGQIEDEGILMAIQSHGLQSGKQVSINPSSRKRCICSARRRLGSFKIAQPQREYLRDYFDMEYDDNSCPMKVRQMLFAQGSTEERMERTYLANGIVMNTDDDEDEENKNNKPTNDTNAYTANATGQVDVDDRVENNLDPLKMNDTDFLDAAVAVAIQKKGLTSYKPVNCD